MSTKQEIETLKISRKFIENGEIEKAFESLENICKTVEADLKNQYSSLYSRFNLEKRKEILGTSDSKIELNKIIDSLLNFISDLETYFIKKVEYLKRCKINCLILGYVSYEANRSEGPNEYTSTYYKKTAEHASILNKKHHDKSNYGDLVDFYKNQMKDKVEQDHFYLGVTFPEFMFWVAIQAGFYREDIYQLTMDTKSKIIDVLSTYQYKRVIKEMVNIENQRIAPELILHYLSLIIIEIEETYS